MYVHRDGKLKVLKSLGVHAKLGREQTFILLSKYCGFSSFHRVILHGRVI